MVSLRGDRRGGSSLGCLVTLLFVALALYYGLDIGRMYWKYFQLKDEMANTALFARSRTDEEIVRHLAAVARGLDLPVEATRFRIQRVESPKTVRISTQYRVTLELPFHHRVIQLRPNVNVRQH